MRGVHQGVRHAEHGASDDGMRSRAPRRGRADVGRCRHPAGPQVLEAAAQLRRQLPRGRADFALAGLANGAEPRADRPQDGRGGAPPLGVRSQGRRVGAGASRQGRRDAARDGEGAHRGRHRRRAVPGRVHECAAARRRRGSHRDGPGWQDAARVGHGYGEREALCRRREAGSEGQLLGRGQAGAHGVPGARGQRRGHHARIRRGRRGRSGGHDHAPRPELRAGSAHRRNDRARRPEAAVSAGGALFLPRSHRQGIRSPGLACRPDREHAGRQHRCRRRADPRRRLRAAAVLRRLEMRVPAEARGSGAERLLPLRQSPRRADAATRRSGSEGVEPGLHARDADLLRHQPAVLDPQLVAAVRRPRDGPTTW